MSAEIRQQIVVSGVGGQGVLFIARLLAETAMARGLPVFTSETHGMAQRGGTVISHIKVGVFASPLIRAGQADGLVALVAENVALHTYFLRPGGWTAVNGPSGGDGVWAHDATAEACALGQPRAVNLILLGFAMGRLAERSDGSPGLLGDRAALEAVLKARLGARPEMAAAALESLEAGFRAGCR
jgi:indolepyruvate ferredoxin oxidoreductase beta subunit